MSSWVCRGFAAAIVVVLVDPGGGTRAQTTSNLAIIEWKVEAGFSPFAALPDAAAVSATWLPRAVGGTLESFAQWYNRVSVEGRSPYAALLDSPRNPWDAVLGRYREEYARPASVAILARAPGAGTSCRWTVTTPGEAVSSDVTAACASWQRLDVALAGTRLSVAGETTTGSTDVRVNHRVVVGLGDSYGSGEGNPDVPTQWKPGAAPVGSYRWLSDPGKDGSMIAAGARWWDTACHRSFWSHQSYVAMRLAAENPHRLVTFLHYACSAAEVFDGVLVRQHDPPGMESCQGLRCFLVRSQVGAAIRDLCDGSVVTSSAAIGAIDANVKADARLYFMKSYKRVALDLAECRGRHRRPDLVLLSIGGNDVGFGALAGWAVTPSRARTRVGKLLGSYALLRGTKVTCPEKAIQTGCREPYDVDLIRQLPRRFTLLAPVLTNLLGVSQDHVVVTTYPDPLRDRKGEVCGDKAGFRPESPWAGAHSQLPVGWLRNLTGIGTKWDFNLLATEAVILSRHTLPNLRGAIEASARSHGFVVASGAADAFVGHCWTERNEGDAPTALPSARPADWSCTGQPAGSPSCWRPFTVRQRFIRTINDALLTQSSARADDMTGAVHPTAQGHAAVADRVLEALRTVPGLDANP
ncbi:MAG: hypothetical protein AB7H93_09905 [Vicinamibacterales bacterium]